MEQFTDNDQAELCKQRLQWMKSHREEYGGRYVALDRDQLVAVGPNYRVARAKAAAAGYPNAFVDYLPKLDEIGQMGGRGEAADIELAWSEEIKRRLTEIDASSVTLTPWEEVRAELFGSVATASPSQP